MSNLDPWGMVTIEGIANSEQVSISNARCCDPNIRRWHQEVLTSIFTAEPLCVYEAELAISLVV